MSNPPTIQVWALGEGKVPAIAPNGMDMIKQRRYIGRNPDGSIKPEGEPAPDCIYVRKCIADGSLTDVDPNASPEPAVA